MTIYSKGMSRTNLITLVAIGIVATGAAFLYLAPAQKPAFYIDPSDQRMINAGQAIYAQHCAACHGVKLEGQPDWRIRLPNGRLRAPPHDATGHTWHHADSVLFDIVKHGLVAGKTAPSGHESDMPAYRDVLSDSEIMAVLAYIKSTWPQEIRDLQQEASSRHEREQEALTASD